MKKLSLIIIISFFTLTSFKSPKKIIGNWSVVKIENNGTLTQEKFIDWISFEKEGVLQLGKNNKNKSGIWTYNESEKSIIIRIEKNPMTEFKIVELSKKKLTIKNKENTMYLEKKQ